MKVGPCDADSCSSKVKYGARKRNRIREATEDALQGIEVDSSENTVVKVLLLLLLCTYSRLC